VPLGLTVPHARLQCPAPNSGEVYCPWVVQRSELVGTWRLTSSTRVGEDGVSTRPWGEAPIGFITYTDNWMSVHIMSSDRPSDSEKAAAGDTYVSYAGTYAVVDDEIHHHIQASSRPDWVGTILVRRAGLDGGALTLSSVSGGLTWTNEWTPFIPS